MTSTMTTDPPAERLSRVGVGATDAIWLAAIVLGLIAFYLSTYPAHGYPFPVGADAPVYLGWMRLAASEGLSSVGGRAGVPALSATLGGTLGLDPAAAIAALEVALAVCAALGAVALIVSASPANTKSHRDARSTWIAAGVFTGLFAVHLAVGYLASLAAAALFLGAAALLAFGTRKAAVGAAAMLAATGFSHPEFFSIGAAVLLLTSVFSFLDPRNRGSGFDSEHGRIALALTFALAAFGLGSAALLRGPAPLRVDTSRDDFLQHAGLGSMLRGLFAKRLAQHALSYVPLVSLPLAGLGFRGQVGFLGRFLRSWGLVLVVGVLGGLVTGWFPAERMVSFAFVIPIAAGMGTVRLWNLLAGADPNVQSVRARLAYVLVGTLAVAFAYGSFLVWFRTPPEIWPLEVQRATEAGRYASASPPGTPLVFTVSNREPIASFFATEGANVLRASVPPDRIRDVRVVVPDTAALPPTEENRRLVDLSLRAALAGSSQGAILWFDLAPFDRANFGKPFDPSSPNSLAREKPEVQSEGVAIVDAHPRAVTRASDPLRPSSPAAIAVATLVVLATLWVAGYDGRS